MTAPERYAGSGMSGNKLPTSHGRVQKMGAMRNAPRTRREKKTFKQWRPHTRRASALGRWASSGMDLSVQYMVCQVLTNGE